MSKSHLFKILVCLVPFCYALAQPLDIGGNNNSSDTDSESEGVVALRMLTLEDATNLEQITQFLKQVDIVIENNPSIMEQWKKEDQGRASTTDQKVAFQYQGPNGQLGIVGDCSDLTNSNKDENKPCVSEKQKRYLLQSAYFSWGYNRAQHNVGPITFDTPDGTFQLRDAVMNDRPTTFSLHDYFGIQNIWIPQYNIALGITWQDTKHPKVAVGMEVGMHHMKAVLDNTLKTTITGEFNRQVVIYVPELGYMAPTSFEEAKQLQDIS